MAFEKMIKNAFEESRNNCRFGDTIEEITEIQNYIKNAERICIPNKNGIKVEVLNQVLSEYGLPQADILQINTNTADTSRIPALAKAYMALDQSDADLIIARGRLGIPGSGSLLIFIDNKGRILTCGTSPSHLIHQKSIEEATALEMPSLQQNLPIVATMTTLGTLVGLLGTVIGMIKSFQALSASGAPDSTALSAGISEALINTAFGIATGAFAVIGYNFYTNKIDHLTYAIDEIGFSIVQSFAASH